MYPIRRSKGVFFVVADGQEFLVYCARGSQVCQLFCWVPQKTCRYCSRGLIGSFAGSISLRVICCADVLMDLEKVAEF